MLFQIHEPGQTPQPHSDQPALAVGIDLGTTHSLVALCEAGGVRVLPDENGQVLLPSVVTYGDHEIRSIKRLMGKGISDIRKISGTLPFEVVEGEGMARLKVGEKNLTPVELSAEILRTLKARAESALGQQVQKAVITVPAYFDDAARTATKDAARLAGLEVLRLLNEPTAAALAYGLDHGAEGLYIIYDLGGGTFDVSLLKMEKGVFRVLATGGDTRLGGDDFDHEVVELFLWQYKNQANAAPSLTPRLLNALLKTARKAKEHLSIHHEASFLVELEDSSFNATLTRTDFERAILPFVDKTLAVCRNVLEDADVDMGDIHGVVLVGGSTRVPLVYEKVAEFFGQAPLKDVNPDEVVAVGAAIQAAALTRGASHLLLDVLPLSLGLVTMGGIVEKIIHRNTTIPVGKSQEFTTYQDGQTGMQIQVVQGEREMASENRSLAYFELKGIPPLKAGMARVQVTFMVDADGVLTVTARETTTGVEQRVEVKPSYGLTEEEIQRMLYDAMRHGQSDMAERLLTESRVEAERAALTLTSSLTEDPELITPLERETLDKKLEILNNAIHGDDRDAIEDALKGMEAAAEAFVARKLEKHVSGPLKGRTLAEVAATFKGNHA